MKWNLEETEKVRESKGYITISPVDFWIVLNSAYNDYHDLFGEDVDKYAEYAKLFILDTDAEEGKVYTYFTTIPKR